MADQLPYCIHCGAQQLNADAKFCHRCGQPIEPVKPGRRQLPPWVAPVLVSAAVIVVAAVVLASVLSRGPTASKPTAATPTQAVQSPAVQVTPTIAAVALMRETPTPPTLTETPQPTPTLANITPGPMRLTRLAWSPDGKFLAVGSATGVYLYDTGTWREARFIPLEIGGGPSPEYGVTSLIFSFDGTLIATEGHRPQVRRVADGGFMYELGGQAPLAASPTEGLWVTHNGYGDSASRLQLRRTSDGQLVREIPTGTRYGVLHKVIFSADGQLIGVAAEITEGFVVLRVSDGAVISKAHENSQWLMLFGSDLAFRPGDSTMAVTGTGDLLGLWDARSGTLIQRLAGVKDYLPGAEVMGVNYAPNGTVFVTTHTSEPDRKTGAVQLWSADGTRGRSWRTAGRPLDSAFSPDSTLLAVVAEQVVYLWRLSDGSLILSMQPAWHQGILPTPTPTPLALGLNLPADWQVSYATRYPVRFKYPARWTLRGQGTDGFAFIDAPLSEFNSESGMQMMIDIGYQCADEGLSVGDPAIVERLKSLPMWGSGDDARFVAGGKWPILLPATYAEVDSIDRYTNNRRIRSLWIEFAQGESHCIRAYLIDEPEDITDQVRLDVSRVLASIEFEDSQHPFPTATPTVTPTPNASPQPALPLRITLSAKVVKIVQEYPLGEITQYRKSHYEPSRVGSVTHC